MRFNKARGIGGSILREEDFVVQEILSRRMRSFERGKAGIEKSKGPYTLLKLTKKGMTTEMAVRKISEICRVREDSIGYAGLKDKFALTTQYITIRDFPGGDYSDGSMTLEKAGMSSKALSPGDLEGNAFEITLHGCRSMKNLKPLIESLKEKGMPNYFGGQRFGKNKDNHIIGKHILKGEYGKALELMGRKAGIRKIEKKKIKFYIHAYQSYIFNKMLDEYIRKGGKPVYSDVPIIGCSMKIGNDAFGKILKQIMKSEKITPENFRINGLKMSCSGGRRRAFVKPIIEELKAEDRAVKIRFMLPKGSYATVLIRELTG